MAIGPDQTIHFRSSRTSLLVRMSVLFVCLLGANISAPPVHAQEFDHLDKIEKHYDHFVVGAGPSGSVVASRIAQASHTVPLFEAGTRHESDDGRSG